MLLAGTGEVLPGEARRRDYLAYHRDWLIRYPVLQSGHGTPKVHEIFDLLDSHVEKPRSLGLDGLWRTTERSLPGSFRTQWTVSLGELVRHVSAFEGEPGYDLDPFVSGPTFPILFRVLHALARRFRLALLDEAALFHLLLTAQGAGARDGFCLAPHLQGTPAAGIEVPGGSPPSFEMGYEWPRWVALSGDDARSWLRSYFRSRRDVGEALHGALQRLRQGEVQEGRELLDRVEAYRRRLRNREPALFQVLGRFYHGENAYYRYRIGDLAGAYEEMDRAGVSVQRAIEARRFLEPLAPLVVDVALQKARIARRERDWTAMAHHLRTMYEMETARRPLCTLDDGTRIDYGSLASYFETLDLDEEEAGMAGQILDPEARLRQYRRLTGRLYLPQGFITVS